MANIAEADQAVMILNCPKQHEVHFPWSNTNTVRPDIRYPRSGESTGMTGSGYGNCVLHANVRGMCHIHYADISAAFAFAFGHPISNRGFITFLLPHSALINTTAVSLTRPPTSSKQCRPPLLLNARIPTCRLPPKSTQVRLLQSIMNAQTLSPTARHRRRQ